MASLSLTEHLARVLDPRQASGKRHSLAAVLNSSWSLYQQLLDEERLDCEWEAKGLRTENHRGRS